MHIFKAVSELHVDGAGPSWVGWPPGGGLTCCQAPSQGPLAPVFRVTGQPCNTQISSLYPRLSQNFQKWGP